MLLIYIINKLAWKECLPDRVASQIKLPLFSITMKI